MDQSVPIMKMEIASSKNKDKQSSALAHQDLDPHVFQPFQWPLRVDHLLIGCRCDRDPKVRVQ